MAHVTKRRLDKIASILDRYRDELCTNRRFNAPAFEREVRDELNFDYTSIKTFVPGLCKYPEHLHVAVYFMRHMNTPGPIAEHKLALAKAFGIRNYDSEEREQAEESFWAAFFGADP